MTEENQRKLFDRFKFFHPEKSMQETSMCFGFECGDGWFDIIWDLCEEIESLLKNDPDIRKIFEVVQVKEKFGSLRFYTSIVTEEIFNAIQNTEILSAQTCEICGKPGQINNDGGWMSCLCSEHRQQSKYERSIPGELSLEDG